MFGFPQKESEAVAAVSPGMAHRASVLNGYAVAGIAAEGSSTSTGTPQREVSSSIPSSFSAIRPDEDRRGVFSPGRTTTWKDAQRAYCLAHGTLRASIRDILNDTCDENQEVPWPLPRRGEFSTKAAEVAELLQRHNPVSGSSEGTSGTRTHKIFSVLSRLRSSFNYAVGYDDGDDDKWVQEQDDAFREEVDEGRPAMSAAPDLTMPIVNLEMAKAALAELQSIIKQQSTATSPYILVGRPDWAKWVSSTTAALSHSSILSKVPTSDQDFLLQVLEEMKQAKVIVREREAGRVDVVVLASAAMMDDKSEGETTKDTIPDYLQVHVALWDISIVEQSIEKQIDEWSERAVDCNSKALLYKRKNQKALALNQLAKRKAIQQRIESSSMALIQLEKLKSAIETAQSNKLLLEHMSASTKVLKDLRLQTPLEQIENIQDDWQTEYEQLQDAQESLSSMGKLAISSYDDDELLEELQNLTLENEPPHEDKKPPPQEPPVRDDRIRDLETRLLGLGDSLSETETRSTATEATGKSAASQAAS